MTMQPIQIESVQAEKRGRGRPRVKNDAFIPELDIRLKQVGKSLYSISQNTGIGHSTLYNVFTGRHEPSLRLSLVIAQQLGWTVEWFSQYVLSEHPLANNLSSGHNSRHANALKTDS